MAKTTLIRCIHCIWPSGSDVIELAADDDSRFKSADRLFAFQCEPLRCTALPSSGELCSNRAVQGRPRTVSWHLNRSEADSPGGGWFSETGEIIAFVWLLLLLNNFIRLINPTIGFVRYAAKVKAVARGRRTCYSPVSEFLGIVRPPVLSCDRRQW